MSPPESVASLTPVLPARERLLQAAAKVFAREGLQGATTRVIAQQAGVNEVTLFRLFENKERLLAEVLSHECQNQRAVLTDETPWVGDLGAALRQYAQAFNTMLEKNEAMIRTLIGEGHRHPDYVRQVIHESVKPSRDRFVAYLETARRSGRVRKGVNLAAAADLFTGMLLSGMLRRTSRRGFEYSSADYLDTCVDVFVSGIAPQAPRNAKPQAARRRVM
jgi:AcrR family transcriptional regulator